MTDWHCIETANSSVAIDNRGLQYGDGLFETVAVRLGVARLWRLHVDRLREGCARLGLDAPDFDVCLGLIEKQDIEYGVGKIIVTAAPSTRGYARSSRKIETLVKVSEARPLPASCYHDGIAVIHCNTRLATGSPLAGLKTLNRLEQVLARNEVTAADTFEGITCDIDGKLICGTMSNVFVVRENEVTTPSLARCGVAGIMRRHIIESLTSAGRSVRECEIESIDDADEVFLSNSQFGILPVRACGERRWPVGPVTCAVSAILADNGVTEMSE